jgi:DNA polymerase-1
VARQLYLIDGNSLVYRAFFALPESIATSDGRHTNAIFGFASMLVKLLTDHGVQPTGRRLGPRVERAQGGLREYKGHRPKKPDLLAEQYPHMEPLVDAFGYTNYGVEGFEADDVIATLAEKAKQEGIEVTVVTGDRDAFQLVGDGVKVMATSRGITETKTYDAARRRGALRHPAREDPDFYGLKGDTSDNIPGVPGIGDKTAATCCSVRRPRGRAGQHRRDLRRQAQGEPDRRTPRTRGSRRSSPPPSATCPSSST